MPSGVIRLRMSRKYHAMPMQGPHGGKYGTDDQGDLSGLRGTQTPGRHVPTLEHEMLNKVPILKAPAKHRAFGSTERMYPTTPPPRASEEGLDGEGRHKIKAQRQKRSK